MYTTRLPSLGVVALLAASAAAKTASLYSQKGCSGDSKAIPWSQCTPTFENKSIDVPSSDKPDQVLFDCYLYSMKSDTTCEEDRQKPPTGKCTDNLYYYSKCVFVPAPGFVSLYQYPNFEGESAKINITETKDCKQLSFSPSQLRSVVVADGYVCQAWRDTNCLTELRTIDSPGNANLDLSSAESISCSENPARSEDIRHDL
ncbi:hypothetical protein ETB97_004891 [Aspergillus alliaceus]|uniref:Uncharacterized protein n=1 Tax=Petromyces alliaceus TaxID=209559 RepID=A0A8H5ZWA3_PETAA|nr:hypothetical protein ETB97_004891 [Aspergillus burnettii]